MRPVVLASLAVTAAATTAATVLALSQRPGKPPCCDEKGEAEPTPVSRAAAQDVQEASTSALGPSDALEAALGQYASILIPDAAKLEQLQQDFRQQMAEGLAADVPVDGKHMLMLPTYVLRLPDGSEQGDCYAIDIGGTNFRVMYVRLSSATGAIEEQDVHEVSLPKEVYTGPGEKLFDFLAGTISDFIDRHSSGTSGGCSRSRAGAPPAVGFCFSFPVKQTALDSGILLDWTKGFTASGVIGSDPVELLKEALRRAGRDCEVRALLNDTVGVLAAQRYLDSHTHVGVIIGTGTNACYVEDVARVTKWQRSAADPSTGDGALPPGTQTAINMEWGAFFSEHLPRCPEDDAVDAGTLHAGKYLYEKLMSGMFLGEVARRILVSLLEAHGAALLLTPQVSSGNATGVAVPEALLRPDAFTTAKLSQVVEDDSPTLEVTARVLADTLALPGPKAVPPALRGVAKRVCVLVARRSALLVAVGLVALLRFQHWDKAPKRVTIAFDGGVYERFVAYRGMVAEAVAQLWGEQRAAQLMPHISFTALHDGSCLGAAVLAAATASTAAVAS